MDSLKTLLSTEHLQRRYQDWKLEAGSEEPTLIALFGQWNAGKSSLVNALLDRPELVPTGPTPEPGLCVVAVSSGTPVTARSTPVMSLVYLRRINDTTPPYVGSGVVPRRSGRTIA